MTLKTSLKRFRSTGVLALLIALICIVFSLTTGGLFVTSMNIKNILVSSALNGIVGIGMTFVLITGGIDLSVSGNVVMTSLIMAQMMKDGTPWGLVLTAGLLMSTAVGLINGISVGKFKMVAFIVTMAIGNIIQAWQYPADVRVLFDDHLFTVAFSAASFPKADQDDTCPLERTDPDSLRVLCLPCLCGLLARQLS